MDTISEKDTIQLNELIKRLTNLIAIERIYRIEQTECNTKRTGLVILVSKSTKVLSEITPICNMVLADYPKYWYRAYFSYIVKEGIKRGNLFFYDTCRPHNLLYSAPTSSFILISQSFNLDKMLDRAKNNFHKQIDKISAFKEGALFYYEKKNYSHTAFMVHQQIEISYRAIEIFTMGKDKVTHSIRVHQDYVRPHMQDLGNVFDEDNAEEDKLMRHLDEAYLAVRYEDSYIIKKENILLAIEKAELVYKMVNQVYEDMVSVFFDKHIANAPNEENREEALAPSKLIQESNLKPIKAEEITNLNQPISESDPKPINKEGEIIASNPLLQENDLKSIVEKIAVHKGSKRIYCFGRRTHEVGRRMFLINNENNSKTNVHYDLLVITKGNIEQELYNLQGLINSNPELSYTVLILVHEIGYVKKNMADANRFFHLVFANGELIYTENEMSNDWIFECSLENQEKERNVDKFRGNWYHRYWNAKGLIDGATNLTDYECCAVQLLMFNQAIEQICIGLIYSFLDYKPARKSLDHLYDICCSFMTFPDVVFPRKSEYDLKLFNIVVESFNQFRYKGWCDIADEDLHTLGKRCENLLEMANNSVSTHLDEMQNKISQSTFDGMHSIEIT